MERLKWILVKGGPAWLAVAGGLIMFAFGFRGYQLDTESVGQWGGVAVAVAGGIWFLVRFGLMVGSWFTK